MSHNWNELYGMDNELYGMHINKNSGKESMTMIFSIRQVRNLIFSSSIILQSSLIKTPAASGRCMTVQTVRSQRDQKPTKSEGSFGRRIHSNPARLKQAPFSDTFAIWSPKAA